MIRALSSLCFLAVLWFGSNAEAQDKIAVLGLEVSGTIDPESTRVASELTQALRRQVQVGKRYVLAPGGDKELLDEKLMNNCSNEEVGCMTAIGKNLGADVLLWGRIEKKSLDKQVGYQVWLRMLVIANTGNPQNHTDFIPLAEANTVKLGDWARKFYRALAGEGDLGTLVLQVNTDRGTILIDGEERANITSGRGVVDNLAPGRYRVAVVAKGFERWEAAEAVTIRSGETTSQDVRLVALGGMTFCDPAVSTCENTTGDGSRTKFWKGLMVGGIVLAVGGGVTWGISYGKLDDAEQGLCSGRHENEVGCMPELDPGKRADLEDQGRKFSKFTYVAAPLAIGGVVLGVVGLVKGYVLVDKEKAAAGGTTVGRRARRRPSGFAVTPVVTPQSAGATLRIDW